MHRDMPTPQAIIPATNVLGEGVLWGRTGTMIEGDTAGVRGLPEPRFPPALCTAESMPLG